jgi:hypothetical protein
LDAYEKKQLEQEFKNYLKSIQKRCVEILQEEIYTSLYSKYEPSNYIRSYQLLENIISEIDMKDGSIYVHLDGDNSVYYSAVDDSPMTDLVPLFVNYGHEDGTGVGGMYHSFKGKHFFEKAARRIKKELGVRVAIIKDLSVTYIDD